MKTLTNVFATVMQTLETLGFDFFYTEFFTWITQELT